MQRLLRYWSAVVVGSNPTRPAIYQGGSSTGRARILPFIIFSESFTLIFICFSEADKHVHLFKIQIILQIYLYFNVRYRYIGITSVFITFSEQQFHKTNFYILSDADRHLLLKSENKKQ